MLVILYTALRAAFSATRCIRNDSHFVYGNIHPTAPPGQERAMTDHENLIADAHAAGGNDRDEDRPTERAVYHVNTDRKGRVEPHGETLTGREILSRAGLNADKYELWTVVGNKTGAEIKPDEAHFVKPGAHFRATIRGTDYSSPGFPSARQGIHR